jgi:hypothetical protein
MSVHLLPKYQMKMLLYFNTEVGREYIFKLIVRSKNLPEIGDDSGVILIFITSGGLIGKGTMFPHCRIHMCA